MADIVIEDQKSEEGSSELRECSSVMKKGLAEKKSHALFVNLNKEAGLTGKKMFFAEDSEGLTEKERRKKLGNLDIVMTGFVGLKGSVILANEKYESLLERYPASFLEEAKRQERLLWQIPEAAPAGKSDNCGTCSFSVKGIVGMYLLSQGGVFAGLWNMGKLAGVGLKVYCKNIPIKQETIEICNFFDVNPYQMLSEGSCLILSENGCRVRERLFEQGISSEIIGFTTEDKDRIVLNGEEQRYLEKHYTDALDLIV